MASIVPVTGIGTVTVPIISPLLSVTSRSVVTMSLPNGESLRTRAMMKDSVTQNTINIITP